MKEGRLRATFLVDPRVEKEPGSGDLLIQLQLVAGRSRGAKLENTGQWASSQLRSYRHLVGTGVDRRFTEDDQQGGSGTIEKSTNFNRRAGGGNDSNNLE